MKSIQQQFHPTTDLSWHCHASGSKAGYVKFLPLKVIMLYDPTHDLSSKKNKRVINKVHNLSLYRVARLFSRIFGWESAEVGE